jgi:hypothetical protein
MNETTHGPVEIDESRTTRPMPKGLLLGGVAVLGVIVLMGSFILSGGSKIRGGRRRPLSPMTRRRWLGTWKQNPGRAGRPPTQGRRPRR